jgi:SnoaL-like domain
MASNEIIRNNAMSSSISTLLTRNLHDVFGENDPARRRAAIDQIYTEDCVFHEPRGVHRGRDEIDRVAGAIKATHPDFQYQPIARPRNWAMAGGFGGSRAVLVRRQLTPGLISSLPATAGLPPYISFSTSYPELSKETCFMSTHLTVSPNEAADRLAIRELVEAYAHCADRRDANGQMSLFTADTHFVVYMNAKDPTPSQELLAREALAPVFADLNKYDATTHFIGQSTILSLTNERATGEAYCLAHHVTVDGDTRRLMVASLRYHDAFVKIDEAWLFSERRLYVDWINERPLS